MGIDSRTFVIELGKYPLKDAQVASNLVLEYLLEMEDPFSYMASVGMGYEELILEVLSKNLQTDEAKARKHLDSYEARPFP